MRFGGSGTFGAQFWGSCLTKNISELSLKHFVFFDFSDRSGAFSAISIRRGSIFRTLWRYWRVPISIMKLVSAWNNVKHISEKCVGFMGSGLCWVWAWSRLGWGWNGLGQAWPRPGLGEVWPGSVYSGSNKKFKLFIWTIITGYRSVFICCQTESINFLFEPVSIIYMFYSDAASMEVLPE